MHPFVVLHHKMPNGHARSDHWDLMLREDGVLKTWALDRFPFENMTCNAAQLPDHDLKYLTYEGPIAGDRGEVKRIVKGSYCWLKYSQSDTCVAQFEFDSETWTMTLANARAQEIRFKRT